MSKNIKEGFLQPGNYTIRAKGYTRVCSAEEESGFTDDGNVYAESLETDELLFNLEENCCFHLKNNDTNKETTLTVSRSGAFVTLSYEEDDSSDEDDSEIYSGFADDYDFESDEYYFEEFCPNGEVEKTFTIDEPVDLSDTEFGFYNSKFTNNALLIIEFPVFSKPDQIIAKGNDARKFHSIEDSYVSDVSQIRAYLDGIELENLSDPSATFTESFDGFVIKDGVLKAYKGYSDKIVIPERVTEIADNVFLFPIESISMPNKDIKVGKNFPWDKVL